jgi:pilus assembly protein FimV
VSAAAPPRSASHKFNALALSTLLAFGSLGSLASFDARALDLGRLNVLSSIGEPLRAEIEITDVTAEEVGSLRPSLASAEVYKAVGHNYNPDLSSLQFKVQQTPDGRTLLQLNNSRPVTAAFVDIVLEVSWASGKITRDFTLLLTPPKSASAAQPVAPVLPMTAARVSVVRGDTAGQLAMQSLPVNVSLDQMLLALLRSNPDAFVAGNVNRLKAGAVLTMPSADAATSVPRAEARQTILAQSRDFNAFRQQLASNARPAQVAASGREATGKVQSAVEEKTPVAAAADKLTLSKGALKGTGTSAGTADAADQLAQERQAKDAAERLAELSKNISDLNKLEAVPASPASPAIEPTPTPAASPPELALATGALPAVTAPADSAPPSWLERLSNNPLVLPVTAGFLGLLLAWGFIRSRRHAAAKNTAFKAVLDDADRANQAADEPEEPSIDVAAQKNVMPTPVARQEPFEDDPLNLAQAALDLGREAQAEALLLGALKRTPHRLALHLELMDIYIARGDAASFEALAIEALSITSGKGVHWTQICKKGQALDPTNPLYQSAAPSLPPTPPFSKLDFDLELGTDAPAKAPPRTKS